MPWASAAAAVRSTLQLPPVAVTVWEKMVTLSESFRVTSTELPASAVPVKTSVVSLVMKSAAPESVVMEVMATAGAVVSIINSLVVASFVLLPAAS